MKRSKYQCFFFPLATDTFNLKHIENMENRDLKNSFVKIHLVRKMI